MATENRFKFKAKSYPSDTSNVLINVDFIFEHKLKCLENVFIKPLNCNENTEIQVILLPKLSININEIHIPNWIFKYWENEKKVEITNLEIQIQIINENSISICESITISKLSKNIFFPTKFKNFEAVNNKEDNEQLQKNTPLNAINWKDILLRNANNKIIKLNSAFSIFVSANPCLFKIMSINNDKTDKEKIYQINENTKISYEREINLDKRIPWGLENEKQKLIDLLSYNEIENNLQKQLNIQKFNGIIINGAIGVGKHEIVKDVCSALDIPIYPLSILKMNLEYSSNEETSVNATNTDQNKIYNYLHKVIDKAKLSSPSVVLVSELDLLANGNNDSEINKISILKDLEKILEKIKDDNSIHIIGLTENKKFLPELFSKNQIFSNVINIDIPNRKEREVQLSYILKDIPLERSFIINNIENEDDKNKSLAEIYAKYLSELTPGYVRNNLKQLFNYAIQHSFIRNDKKITTEVDDLINMMESLSLHEK